MNHPRGFTLVEAAVVIAVAAILAGAILPLVLNAMTDARLPGRGTTSTSSPPPNRARRHRCCGKG